MTAKVSAKLKSRPPKNNRTRKNKKKKKNNFNV